MKPLVIKNVSTLSAAKYITEYFYRIDMREEGYEFPGGFVLEVHPKDSKFMYRMEIIPGWQPMLTKRRVSENGFVTAKAGQLLLKHLRRDRSRTDNYDSLYSVVRTFLGVGASA